ncbi:hypothetical protein Cgig2_023092 [Carnegiea gigantea]|uniref:Uncharacterized protein n=1 Tax=Carnegiea gigantea TaxID=171969 RepID=A0A9Q1GP04_9CARY|nr:hypothetical protein Cgig2_023092 [Carnegiea gigantea]
MRCTGYACLAKKIGNTAQNKGEEPTDIILLSETHQSCDPKTKGKWVDGKSQQKAISPYIIKKHGSMCILPTSMHLSIHFALVFPLHGFLHEERSSHLSSDDSSQGPVLSERDMWVQANQDSKGRVHGFGWEGSKLKSIARLSVSTRSSSVKNYDACEIATRFNESVSNQVERENREALLKKVDYLADARKKDKSKIKMT